MQATLETAEQRIGEMIDAEIDQVLAAYGGDVREIIRVLLIERASREREIFRLASRGFPRRLPLERMRVEDGQ